MEIIPNHPVIVSAAGIGTFSLLNRGESLNSLCIARGRGPIEIKHRQCHAGGMLIERIVQREVFRTFRLARLQHHHTGIAQFS